MIDSPSNVNPEPKTHRLKPAQRRNQVAALLAAGFTQQAAADALGVDRSTIVRDVDEIRPDVEEVKSIIDRAQARIREILPIEQRVDEYVEMLGVAKTTKQPSAGMQILARLDAIDGLVTDVERMRSKAPEQQSIVPLFSFGPGAMVNVTVSTTGSGLRPESDAQEGVIDVTPTKQSEPSET